VTNVASLRPRAEAFAEVWLGRPAGADREVMASRILRCAALVPPVDVPGNARPVDAGELATLYDWEDAFHDELGLTHHSPDDARPDPTGRAFWWVDGDSPVSLAIHTPPVQGVARVGPVYTPPESRRRGYAAAVTAAATRAAYDTGAREVVLYTDAANPTSNGVYERIGYVHVADAVELRLTDVSGLAGPSGPSG
jgi:GNAT superfamily N-acetyltransferase